MCPPPAHSDQEALEALRVRASRARERGDRVAGDKHLEQNLESLLREGNQIWETFIEARGGRSTISSPPMRRGPIGS